MGNVEITPERSTRTAKEPNGESASGSDEAVLITWLADRDAACPLCSYNIRGLTTARCPECGQALRLSVTLAEPYLKAWVAVIAGLLPPAGVGAIFIVALLREGFPRGGGIEFGPAVAILYVIGCIPLSALALSQRRRFLRLARTTQQAIAISVWVAFAAAFFYMLAMMD